MKKILLKITVLALTFSALPIDFSYFLTIDNNNIGKLYLRTEASPYITPYTEGPINNSQVQNTPQYHEQGMVLPDGRVVIGSGEKYPNGATWVPAGVQVPEYGYEGVNLPSDHQGTLLVKEIDSEGNVTWRSDSSTNGEQAMQDIGRETSRAEKELGMWDTIKTLPGQIANLKNEFLSYFLNVISMAILSIASLFVGLAAYIFDYAISFSIQNFSSMVNTTTGSGELNNIWTELTKMVSMIFIGLLIYTSIATILQLSAGPNTKKVVVNIIILALLVNFSMFFTKIIIDGSNMAAVGLYNKMGQTVSRGCDIVLPGNLKGLCIPGYFFDTLGIQNIFKTSQQSADSAETLADSTKQLTRAILLSGIMWVLTFVFLIGAILFVVRSIVLVILVVLSPIAFAAMALPKTKSMISDKWWKQLTENAIFAPAFMFMMWISVAMINPLLGDRSTAAWNDAINKTIGQSGDSTSLVTLLVNYLIIIVLLVLTIIFSKSAGVYGAGAVVGSIDKFRKGIQRRAVGTVARGTVGRASRALNQGLEKSSFGYTRVGSSLRNITKKGAEAKFGTKQSSIDRAKELDTRDATYEEKKFVEPEFKRQQEEYEIKKEENNQQVKTQTKSVEEQEVRVRDTLKSHDEETNTGQAAFETQIDESKENVLKLKEELNNLDKSAPDAGRLEEEIRKKIENENVKTQRLTLDLQNYNKERRAGRKELEEDLTGDGSELQQSKQKLKELKKSAPKEVTIEEVREKHAEKLTEPSRGGSLKPENYRSGVSYGRRKRIAEIMRNKKEYEKVMGKSEKDKIKKIIETLELEEKPKPEAKPEPEVEKKDE